MLQKVSGLKDAFRNSQWVNLKLKVTGGKINAAVDGLKLAVRSIIVAVRSIMVAVR